MVGICHKQRNIVSSEVIAIDRPGFGRLTTDKTLQRVTILTKLQRLYFRTVVQPLAIDESDILFSLISSNQCTYAEIADILPAKYAHDCFKNHTFAIGAGATKNKHSFHFRHTPVNKNTSKKLLQNFLHVFVRQNFIQKHSPKKDMLFRLVVIGNACSLYPTAVERMCMASIHIKHTVIEHHNGIIRLQGFSCHHTLTDFQYTLHTGIITIGHFAFTHQVIYQIAKIIPCHLFIYPATEIVRRTIELTNRRSYNGCTHQVLHSVNTRCTFGLL